MASLYIHIPFCASRCIYCGFYSTTNTSQWQSQYIDAVLHELKIYVGRNIFPTEEWKTIYFGGGTPSTLPIELLQHLVEGISTVIDTSQVAEWTMECNPDDVTPALAAWIRQSPINRVSMGLQTFDDQRLKMLHRRHTAQQAIDAYYLLRHNAISNISLDLMLGFPGQTLAQWQTDLDTILPLAPEHISAYSLMYEEGTALYQQLKQGIVQEISEETSVAMYETLIDTLSAAGYDHYEISNFAIPNHRSQHNSAYWQQVNYLGLGAAAHSYDGKHRWWNISNLKEYIDNISKGITPAEAEDIDEVTRYNDIITTALRTREGIPLDALQPQHRQYLIKEAENHLKAGNLSLSNNHLHLTRKAILICDYIMTDLIM